VHENGELFSEIHMYCGQKFEDHKLMHLGHVVKDEIVEIIFDFDRSEEEEKQAKETEEKQRAQPTAFAPSNNGLETLREILVSDN
jgi:hypothetical protein